MSIAVKPLLVRIASVGVFLSSFTVVPAADKSSAHDALKGVLNSRGYILADPAESWPIPGGILIARKTATTYISLPSDVSPPAASAIKVDFYGEDLTKKFSLSAVLTGMLAIIGGNPGLDISHSSSQKFTELSAQGQMITFNAAKDLLQNLDQNPKTSKELRQWVSTPDQQVFIVGTTVSTAKISVSSGSSTSIDAFFNGGPVKDCPTSSESQPSNSGAGSSSSSQSSGNGTGSSSSAGASTSTGSSTKPLSGSSSGTAKPANNSNGTKTAGSSSSSSGSSAATSSSTSLPGGALQVCNDKTAGLTMNSDSPLVFAALAYKVIPNADGSVALDPFYALPMSGTMESAGANSDVGARIQAVSSASTSWKPRKGAW